MNNAVQKLVEGLRERGDHGPFEISASQLAAETGASLPIAEAALESLVATGELTRRCSVACPCERAERLDPPLDVLCPACGLEFGKDVPEPPASTTYYRFDAPSTRDVQWMLALHGMNTLGPWQEEFMWRLSRTYGYSVPVAIYKYGVVRPGAILRFRQRALTRGLIARMHALQGDASGSGFSGPPDVIAHSLGTWLLAQALKEDQTLRIGRVVLLGSVIRPDFDWAELIARGQVEAVLCHHSAKDFWARVAHYVIPDSGPAGVIGFNDRTTAVHVGETDLGHSDYFTPERMPRLFADVWQPFFTRAHQRLDSLSDHSPSPGWKQARWIARATLLRFIILAIAGALLVFLALSLAVGARALLFGP